MILLLFLLTISGGSSQLKTSFNHVITTKKLPQKTSTITIGGIFPMSGNWAGGIGCFPAALKALEDVNMNSTILPRHYLVLHSNDSKCEPGLGTNALFDLIREPPTKLMILGPGCSTVSTFVAEAAKMWNLVVLSYGSSSPALSNRKRFPTFFRTHPSATLENPARIKLIKDFNWTHISIVQQIEEVFTTTAENLEQLARQNNVSIVTRQNFLTDPVDAVRNLKKHDARIVIGLFYENMARAVLCAAYKEGLTTSKHVWFLIGWYAHNWYKDESSVTINNSTNCTVAEMKVAAEGHFTVEPVFLDRFGGTTISGITVKKFEDYIHRTVSPTDPGYVEAPLAYDAVWAMALAIDSTINNLHRRGMKIEDFSYTNQTIMNELKSAMEKTTFQGLSSYVAFSTSGDRIAKILIEQLQNDAYVTVGYYDSQTDQLLTHRRGGSNSSRYGIVDYRFYEKNGLPPKDRKLIHFSFWYISLAVVFIVWLMTFLHGCFAISYFVVSRILSDHYIFRASVPWLNCAIIIGSIVANVGVCIWGLANSSLTEGAAGSVFLHLGAFLQSSGFTLAIGGMFLKTLMLRKIVPRSSISKDSATGKPVAEKTHSHVSATILELCWYEKAMAGAFGAFDIIFHVVWPIVDPIIMRIKELPNEERMSSEDDDIYIRPRLFVYECNYLTVWLGVCLGQKGILLLAASFFSFDTRNLKHRLINDSKFISLSVYNIAVFALITVPLTLLIKDKPTASFSFMSGAILLCTWISLGLIAVPKIFALTRRPTGGQNRLSSQSDSSVGQSKTKQGLGLFQRKSAKAATNFEGPSEEANDEITTGNSEDSKLKKLMAENEEIKKQISEKENRLAELRELLLARLQNELLRTNPSNVPNVNGDSTVSNDDKTPEPDAVLSDGSQLNMRERSATVPSGDHRLRIVSSMSATEHDSLLTATKPTTNTELSETYI